MNSVSDVLLYVCECIIFVSTFAETSLFFPNIHLKECNYIHVSSFEIRRTKVLVHSTLLEFSIWTVFLLPEIAIKPIPTELPNSNDGFKLMLSFAYILEYKIECNQN